LRQAVTGPQQPVTTDHLWPISAGQNTHALVKSNANGCSSPFNYAHAIHWLTLAKGIQTADRHCLQRRAAAGGLQDWRIYLRCRVGGRCARLSAFRSVETAFITTELVLFCEGCRQTPFVENLQNGLNT